MVSERQRLEQLRLTQGSLSREPVLQEYYVSFKNWVPFIESEGYGPLDERGIPLVDYKRYSRVSGIGCVYFPVTIAQYALGIFGLWCETGEEKYKKKFLLLSRWLEEHAEPVGDEVVVWPAHFDFPVYSLTSPWLSSMAQSQVISVLLRAYELEKRTELKDMVRKAVASFFIPAGQPGGVRYVDDGDVWFEEYITNPPAHVLNGFIFSLFGVLDYARVTSDHVAQGAWREGIETLERKLHLYDTGYWSRYDLLRSCVASRFYHENIHIPLLRVMHVLTGKETFLVFAERWEQYLARPFSRFRAKYQRLPSRILGRLRRITGEEL